MALAYAVRVGTFMGLVLGIVLGAVLGYVIALKSGGGRGRAGQDRAALARAWQEGYDAGSSSARRPVAPAPVAPTATAPAPSAASATPAPAAPETAAAGPIAPVPAAAAPAAAGPTVPADPASLPAPSAAALSSTSVPPLASPSAPALASPSAPALASPSAPVLPPPSSPALPPPPPPPSPEELAAAKERRDRRNVNITLYTACLLLVAAASLFIGAALPVTARVTGLAVVVGLFYAGGLLVHAVSRTVRPAAVAFTGTGLALVPVFGVALDALVLHDPVLSWLITSAVGTVLLAVAAVRLDSTVIAFLTVPFLLSTVMASGAAVQQGMVWAFIGWIGLAVLMAWLSADDGADEGSDDRADDGPDGGAAADAETVGRRRRWLPGPYREAIARTHQWITPGAVLAAVVVGLWVEPVQMFLLLLAASAYYATVAAIGPRRFRLVSAYAVRAGVLLAVAAWAAMVDWSLPLTLTVLVAYLCVQVPLSWFGRGHDGYLPAGLAAHVDRICCLVAAGALVAIIQAGALFGADGPWLTESLSWALALLVLTTAVLAVASVRTTSEPAAGLGWQAATPLAWFPAVLGWPAASVGEGRPWLGEICLVVIIAVELVIVAVLRRGAGRATRWDGLVALHGAALATVALVFLLVDRMGATGGGETGGWSPSPSLVAGLVALVWATVTALTQRPATDEARVVPPVAWCAATLLSFALLGSTDLVGGWYAVLVVTAGVGLWWIARRPSAPAERIAVLAVAAAVQAGSVLLLSTADSQWHSVFALTVLTAWLVAAAVLTRDRLPRRLRAGVLLAGQAGSALLVSDVVDLLGGNGSAVRGAAAVALVAGLALRSRLAGRLEGLGSGLASAWIVTAALGGLWLVEAVLGADRAALMVVGASLVGAGVVLRVARGGHWAVLAGALAVVLPASSLLRLEGGWLPVALIPTSVASALLVILALAVAGLEIAASVAGTRDDGAPRAAPAGWPDWVTDLRVFRPVAIAVLWSVAVLLGCVAGPDGDPHPGVLGIAAAAAALLCYVFARTRGIPGLTAGTVLAVPVATWLLLQWWRDRDLPLPDDAWEPLLVAVLSAGILGLWARADASAGVEVPGRAAGAGESGAGERGTVERSTGVRGAGESGAAERGAGEYRIRAAALWQGVLAVALVLAATTVLRVPLRAGMPEDAVAWVGCALVVAGCWLAVDAGGRTLLWAEAGGRDRARASWRLNGRDAAVLVTYAAAARAWWQTADPDHSGQALWWTVQVLVVLLVAMGWWHARAGRTGGTERTGDTGRTDRRLGFHLAAATVFTLAALYVLVDGTALMQLTVLAGFGVLVVLGLVQRLQALTWWGAAGVALSVLWYLREYTYVYLALLGAALIALAVWQLRRRTDRADRADGTDQAGESGPTGQPDESGPTGQPDESGRAERADRTDQPDR